MPKPRKPRPLNEAETELFAKMVADAKPLRKRPGVPEVFSQPRKAVPIIARRMEPSYEAVKTLPPINAKNRAAISAMDGRNAERLIKGHMEIEARLDLHGHRHEEAQRILVDFIHRNHSYGKRCALVITGKGGSRKNQPDDDQPGGGRYRIPERKGVLFDLVPAWLSAPELAPYVVAFSPAQPRHGGSGALYVYLRRDRG